MGLLSKAATGTSGSDGASAGGLLKIISQRHTGPSFNDTEQISSPVLNPASPMEKAVMDNLYAGFAKFGIYQGIIIEALKYSAGEFASRLSFMVSGFGSAQGLAPGRALVLFSAAQDGELIGIHLARTVPGNNIFSFQANTPQEAFSLLKPYL